MYLRPVFTITDREVQLNVIREAGWGCLFGTKGDVPIASHLPFLVVGEKGQEKLEGHMSRANPHWETFGSAANSLVVFQGPHTYVTPSLCTAENSLPTWNYAAVHVYGRPAIIDDPVHKRALIGRLVEFRESRFEFPWRLDSLDEDWINQKLRGIVSFEMAIDRMETTFRLMQNRSMEDRRRVADALAAYDDTNSRGVAAMMRRHSLDETGQ